MFLAIQMSITSHKWEEEITERHGCHPYAFKFFAQGADLALGIALLLIGVLSTQFGFLPNSIQFAFIGAGAAYCFGILCVTAFVLKSMFARDRYLIRGSTDW
jgi:hypothetical protein